MKVRRGTQGDNWTDEEALVMADDWVEDNIQAAHSI